MVVGLGQGVHDQGMELPLLFIIASVMQRIDQGPVYCREIRDSLLVKMVGIPPDIVCEFGEMICSPTCHPVLKLGFKGSKVQRICAILTRQDQIAHECSVYINILSSKGDESWRSIVPSM